VPVDPASIVSGPEISEEPAQRSAAPTLQCREGVVVDGDYSELDLDALEIEITALQLRSINSLEKAIQLSPSPSFQRENNSPDSSGKINEAIIPYFQFLPDQQ